MVVAEVIPDLPELTVEQAEHWAVALLAQERALRQYDTYLFPTADDAEALATAEGLHAAWRRWADEGQAFLRRVHDSLKPRTHVAGTHDLDYGVARAYAMLKLSPRTIGIRAEQVRDGKVVKSGEVRDALRVADRR